MKLISWKLTLAVSIILATLAIVSAVGIIVLQLRDTKAEATCRSRYTTRLMAAEADVLIEQISLFVILAEKGDVNAQLTITNLKKATLVEARDERVEYEQHPTTPCPLSSNL